jgi:adenylyltransferase/sulfurtransferase
LCGRNTVQIRPASGDAKIDLASLALKLEPVGAVERHPFLIRCILSEGALSLTVFLDGRAMVHGTSDTALARSIYAKFVGS